MKIAIIDIDGVIANNEARFAKAEEARQEYFTAEQARFEEMFAGSEMSFDPSALNQPANNVYWRTAFTPGLVALDTPIDGVKDALEQIGNFAEYDIYFLTSRPETMRGATMKWLFWNIDFDSDTHLIMKPTSQQYVKTLTWKSGVVELLIRLFGCDELLFVDDENAIQESIAALDLPCDRKIGGSLVEALAMLEETV